MIRAGLILLWAATFSGGVGGADLKCGVCHVEQGREQPKTAMGRALQLPGSNSILKKHPLLTVRKGAYTYRIETDDAASTYSVTDGTDTIQAPIHYSFGAHSQTFVLEYGGHLYEGLISYFAEIDGLDTTIGDDRLHPSTLRAAFGREIDKAEAADCFGCHSTGAGSAKNLDLHALTPGVTCDHCHENALLHQAAALKGKTDYLPTRLSQSNPYQISQFCGQCHRTWETVMRLPIRGPLDVRFQPYRLANSKCFDGADKRLSCTTCHEPHHQLLPEPAAVDTKCLACHTASNAEGAAVRTCPVAKANCAECHMPKVALPGSHRQFTDHQIRVVRKDEAYPN